MSVGEIGLIFTSYFIGSIPVGFLLAKIFVKKDLRAIGSGNIGSTNAYRAGGVRLGAATLLLDVVKTVAAIVIARYFSGDDVVATIFVMLGHIFPVWTKFHGGKGVANFMGATMMFYPLTLFAFLVIWISVFTYSKIASLSSILAIISALIAIFCQSLELSRGFYLFLTLSVVIIVKHHSNIKNILNGTEYRFDR